MIAKEKIERDFARDIWCIFGLPFDNHSIEDICDLIDSHIAGGYQCILSTPNLNWVRISLRDKEFKKAIIKSDANVIDGSPILWISRFLGLPIKEKVPGSTLIEHLLSKETHKKYKLFFFGGQRDAAHKAFLAVNNQKSNIRAVGYHYPGHGSVEEMSTTEIINKLNDANPDILIIALGAKKGISWINRNADKLNAKIISHLGAAIDFIAGNIKRAPKWMQKNGIEWIWRIIQQPVLWKRYLKDGILFVFLFITHVLPYKLFLFTHREYRLSTESPVVNYAEGDSVVTIKITGVCNYLNIAGLRESFKEAVKKNKDIIIDFSATKYIDNSFLGLLFLLFKHQEINQKKFIFKNVNNTLKKVFRLNSLNKNLI